MHEISLCQRILEIVSERASVEAFSHIKNITLNIGVLACVDQSAMHFAFEIISKNTIAEGATLIFNVVPGEATCQDCKKKTIINDFFSACQHCGGCHLMLLSGDEFVIEHMETE